MRLEAGESARDTLRHDFRSINPAEARILLLSPVAAATALRRSGLEVLVLLFAAKTPLDPHRAFIIANSHNFRRSMITKRVFWILALTFMLGVAANAGTIAGTILVTGTGFWDQTTPTTQYTAPGASWDFSFLIPGTIDVVSSGVGFTTTQATSFNYSLGGSPVIASLTSVTFYSLADLGLFDLFLLDGTVFGATGD